MIIILFIRRHVDNFVGNTRILWVGFVYLTVGCLHESIFIDPRIGCQGVDQSDVRTFRRLDGAHSAVVRIMYVTDLESGSVTGQTAGTKGGKTSLMCQLTERVVLIHKLGQLGRTEELLHGSLYRFNVDQHLG